ncbi:MAG: hypothetical protein D6741_05885 [Planctomycetota bacterium]|nr:MAG: hypothetical protein D6741_05885 [Planctomycetota bacterium]
MFDRIILDTQVVNRNDNLPTLFFADEPILADGPQRGKTHHLGKTPLRGAGRRTGRAFSGR